MKPVIVYQAENGRTFSSADACLTYEAMLVTLEQAMEPLGPYVEIPGDSYIQRTREDCFAVRSNLLAIAREQLPDEGEYWDFLKRPDEEFHPHGAFDRLASHKICPEFWHCWGRLGRIDFETFREYQQRWYAETAPEKPSIEIPAYS